MGWWWSGEWEKIYEKKYVKLENVEKQMDILLYLFKN